MAYEFTKLADVPALAEVPEGANAFIEVAGEIKRVPGAGLVGGIPTAIIRLTIETDSDGEWTSISGTCDNMTFAEAKAILTAGEPMMLAVTYGDESYRHTTTARNVDYSAADDAVYFEFTLAPMQWTSDGTITSAE